MKLLLFVSSRCSHCPKAEGVARRLAPEYYKYGLEFQKIRTKTNEGKQLSRQFNIMATPTILLLDNNGEETQRITGVPSENNLKNKIEQELGLKKPFLSSIFGR